MYTVEEKLFDIPDLCGLLPENPLFFDIETTGLSVKNAAIYLIGVVYQSGGQWCLRQWFATERRQEMDILQAFLDFSKDYPALIHFNGDKFDLPFIKACAKQYNLDHELSKKESLDLCSSLRPMAPFLGMERRKQKSFEERVGHLREDIYSGGELIRVYEDYLKNHSEKLCKTLLLHNHDDLRGMLFVASALSYERFLKQPVKLLSTEEAQDEAVLRLESEGPFKVPALAQASYEGMSISVNDSEIILRVPVKNGAVRFYFTDYQNYYYLPKEDTAVHKSVGIYVDAQFRKKATPGTAYQWAPLKLLEENPNQLDAYVHRLFYHYIFRKTSRKRRGQ